MRVAVIGPLTMPNRIGGMTRHCEEIYSRLADRGHDVTVYCAHTPEGERYRGMRLHRMAVPRLGGWDRLWYSARASLLAAFGDHDIVHYHSFSSSGFAFLPPRRGKAVALTVHRFEWQDEKWGPVSRRFLQWSENVAVRSAGAAITVSAALGDELATRHNRMPPMFQVSNGITTTTGVGPEALGAFELRPNGYLLCVGRIVPEKGLDTVLDAVALLADVPPLVVVGGARHGNTYLQHLADRVAHMGGRVRLLGVQTGPTLDALYAHACAFVTASAHEGQPLTVLEAMSQSRCVIASDIAAHREVLGDDGLLFPVGDASRLASVVADAIADPEHREELGRRAAMRIARNDAYSWDHAADETERILTELLAGTSRRK